MTGGASVEGFAGEIVAVAIMVVLIFFFCYQLRNVSLRKTMVKAMAFIPGENVCECDRYIK